MATGIEREMGRVEAFSDGVMAIAVTLLVLGLTVPAIGSEQSLASNLAHSWPEYFSYIVSFLVIGIVWMNHHRMFSLLVQVDRTLIFLNLFLLLWVVALPFTTSLVATYLLHGFDGSVAVAAYSAVSFMMAVGFTAIWSYATRPGSELLGPDVDPIALRSRTRGFYAGLVVYVFAFGIAFLSAVAGFILLAATTAYYAFDQLDG